MNKIFSVYTILLLLFVSLLSVSCDKPDVEEPKDNQEQTDNNGEGEGETTTLKGVTFTIDKVTATKAFFGGTIKEMTPDMMVGIFWNDYPFEHINNTNSVKTYTFVDDNFAFCVNDLPSNSTIYYMPYVYRNGVTEYGDCLSFKTKQVTMTVNKVEVNGTVATFSGIADLDREGGILCSTDSEVSLEHHHNRLHPVPLDEDGTYIHKLIGLSLNTTYYYRTYFYDRGDDSSYSDGVVYGEVMSFTTEQDLYRDAIKDLSLSSAIDLSSNGTANCYVVSKAGLYKIKTVEGNNRSRILSDAFSPAILWETFGTDVAPKISELICGVCYKDGYLIFETSRIFKEGNAVIAVKDSEGTILWSWHIWMIDDPQDEGNYYYRMMDRNLGATSATVGDVGSLGLLYQWGRKDPFLGSSSIDESIVAKSTIIWPSPYEFVKYEMNGNYSGTLVATQCHDRMWI